jgi:zinc transport system ATP-binding protein
MSKTAVHIDNLSVYYGQVPAITGVCLDVADGEYLGIIGPNGGGKSTLLKAILGLIPATVGTVQVYGNNPGKSKSMVGYVPQFAALDKQFPITVLEVVLTGRLKQGLSLFFKFTKEDKKAAYDFLEKVGLRVLQTVRYRNCPEENFKKCSLPELLP